MSVVASRRKITKKVSDCVTYRSLRKALERAITKLLDSALQNVHLIFSERQGFKLPHSRMRTIRGRRWMILEDPRRDNNWPLRQMIQGLDVLIQLENSKE